MVLKLQQASESRGGGLTTTQMLGPHPQRVWLRRVRLGSRIFISNKFSGKADANGSEPDSRNCGFRPRVHNLAID